MSVNYKNNKYVYTLKKSKNEQGTRRQFEYISSDDIKKR